MVPFIEYTSYGRSGSPLILLNSPHDASSDQLGDQFPPLKKWISTHQSQLNDYFALEQDRGATEVCHRIGEMLADDFHVIVSKCTVPRGLLDVGRWHGYGVRPLLTKELAEQWNSELGKWHSQILRELTAHVEKHISNEQFCYLLDVHTMASVCPEGSLPPLSWQNLESYQQAFCEAPLQKKPNIRPVDLITDCGCGTRMAGAPAPEVFFEAFKDAGYEVAFNEPYIAQPQYLMHHLQVRSPRVMAVDIPKHLVAGCEALELNPSSFELDRPSIDKLAKTLAEALEKIAKIRNINR